MEKLKDVTNEFGKETTVDKVGNTTLEGPNMPKETPIGKDGKVSTQEIKKTK